MKSFSALMRKIRTITVAFYSPFSFFYCSHLHGKHWVVKGKLRVNR